MELDQTRGNVRPNGPVSITPGIEELSARQFSVP